MGSVASSQETSETLKKSPPSSSSGDFPIWDEECDRWIEEQWKKNPEELQLYTELYRTNISNHNKDPETSFQHMATLRGLIVQGHKGEQA